MAKSHAYHMFPFEDRPLHYFLDQILADPVLNIPEFVYRGTVYSFNCIIASRKIVGFEEQTIGFLTYIKSKQKNSPPILLAGH